MDKKINLRQHADMSPPKKKKCLLATQNRSNCFPTSPLPIKKSYCLSTNIPAVRTATDFNIHVGHCCPKRSEKCKEAREGSKCLPAIE